MKSAKPKKIVFDDDGEAMECTADDNAFKTKTETEGSTDDDEENDYFAKRDKIKRQKQQRSDDADEVQQKWYEVYQPVIYTDDNDVVEMKENQQMELYNLCKSSYDAEKPLFNKRNPNDARWLQTALHKGTAKDRANAGALLVTSNPLGNLEALTSLIGYTKLSNKASTDVIGVLTDLWMEVLLPPQRKLISINMRGADWKLLRNDTTITKEKQKRRLAYWYFENELKDCYFEFLKNLQLALQNGQENNKFAVIVAATKLLMYSPEKEQMLLTMLVNKLGDPLPKVASKALYHLTELAHRHANMCSVIVVETEKLLFRNNISDRAQHFALCYLASIATAGSSQVCAKLVNICFDFFKVMVQKGAVNNRTMQAILRCLQKSIAEAQSAGSTAEILNKDMQDTVYRLVHLADIRIAVQTLGLLLQLITVKTTKSDRFYNALYKKMLDMDLTNIGTKTAAQLLHIIHRAIHMDSNIPRAKAFIKRILQMALYMPANIAAGCLIVVYKLLKSRRELSSILAQTNQAPKMEASEDEKNILEAAKDESIDVTTNPAETAAGDKAETSPIKTEKFNSTKDRYDPYHRVPQFAGAEFIAANELIMLNEHVHPTVMLFAESLLKHKRISYYGDPLRDFGLPHFLERFAFKNPKKLEQDKAFDPTLAHKRYMPAGSRGQSVKALTKENCTEDEMFIFNYLEKKRQQAEMTKEKKESKTKRVDGDDGDEENDGEGLKPGDVDDDEFDDYLDGFFGKKAKAKNKNAAESDNGDDEDEIDFLKELGGDLGLDDKKETNKKKLKQKKKANKGDDEDLEDIDADWGDDDDDEEVGAGSDMSDDDDDDAEAIHFKGQDSDDEMSDDEAGSIDLNDENDDDTDGSLSPDEAQSDDEDDDAEGDSAASDDDDDDEPKTKNKKKHKKVGMLDNKSFARKLKENKDMSSLFAAADEFAELLEETAKARGQGTTGAIFNKDKSSDKQMKWEGKRRSNTKNYSNDRKRKFKPGGKGETASKGKKFAKKAKF